MKIIINNESTASYAHALNMVSSVISGSRISNGGYCYVTTFKYEDGDSFVVYATKNKNSDTFRVADNT